MTMVSNKTNKQNRITIGIIVLFIISFFVFSFDNIYLNSNDKSLLITQREFYESKDSSSVDGFLMENIHKDINRMIAFELNAKYISHTIVANSKEYDDGLFLSSSEDECLPKLPAFDFMFHISCFFIYYRCIRWLYHCMNTITFHIQSMIVCLHKRDGKKRNWVRYA